MKHLSKSVLLIFIFSAVTVFAQQQETGGVKGKIRTINDKAISEATITARQDGKDIKSAKSDDKGNFEIGGLAPGVYNFVFEKSGFGTGIKCNVEIVRKKTRDLGDNLRLSVDAGMQVIIRGVVFDANGRSLPGANVEIEKKQPDGSFHKISQAVSSYGSDDNLNALTPGEFGFRFLAGGAATFRVTASFKGVSTSQEVNVTNAAIYRLSLMLKSEK
ncbi:MAG: carboxypeptidase-like regulatory domain-containing protein [Pyrinomonadaceae bacterium]